MNKVQDLRQSYERGKLEEPNIPDRPYELFDKWFNEITNPDVDFVTRVKKWVGKTFVGESIEPNAMTLSTIQQIEEKTQPLPVSRTVLMKGYGDMWIEFFTNYESAKAHQIEKNKFVCATFWWTPLQRQVIIRGKAEKVSRERTVEYFNTRPRASKIGAIASSQSEIIESRDEIEKFYNAVKGRFSDKPSEEIPCPEHWGGYRINATGVEFWQGRVGRLHDRIVYMNVEGDWVWIRKAP